ncbi:MAG TPA: translational GTPase TypA [Planctomycetaceae bacterium]|nr:translational GTPase TypA [Pirellulales bacterium]HCK71185.1 translational GTPase TypA [Planctomycetaceae bacterium]HCP85870.1 translational GTPase TypA [Planctomycetaceae bacterium]|tara:strand:- start:1623 stop:3440 length:1818 start_codon:yes stop_codon:yes gene_type:complete
MARRDQLRNIVIIAHVDHGKTTLVDCLLRQSGQFRDAQLQGERILDSNDLERERGITILSKNIALPYEGVKINIIDTPGHADFGGEVERVVRMADGALLLLDAAEGVMPQTRFVLSKALEAGLQPIVVVNKIDRPEGRPHEVLDEAFDLMIDLGGEDLADDFPFVFASAKDGFATLDPEVPGDSMKPLLDLIVEHIPGPEVTVEAPFQMLVTTLDWSEYVGRIAIGRVKAGSVKSGQKIDLCQAGDEISRAAISQLYVFENLGRVEVEEADAGDIVAIVGLEDVEIGDTLCEVDHVDPLPRLTVDEPTLEMRFTINSSPLVGQDGQYVTTRQLRERLFKELERNVALRINETETADSFAVAGRGILHLAILIENMRREGYELSIGKPKVITREVDGKTHEPYETLTVEVPTEKFGPVMELTGERRGNIDEMDVRGDYTYATFTIPARGLIGLRTRLLNATQGTAIMHHRFKGYLPAEGEVPSRSNGVLVSTVSGKAVAFALDSLQQRSDLFVSPGDPIYEGMIVGENARDNDLNVNPSKEKKLTNMRASGSDDNVLLKPPRLMSLEAALEYIEEDELVEITPAAIRLRKILLKEADRRRDARSKK